ncbi:hypothetical protein GW915_13740 [bacterium]|nr:hypothetical protein [bacterium]
MKICLFVLSISFVGASGVHSQPSKKRFSFKRPEASESEKGEKKPFLFFGTAFKVKTPTAGTFARVAGQMEAMNTSYCYGAGGPTRWDCSHATTEIINRVRDHRGESRISYRTSHSYRSYLRGRGLRISCSDVKRGDIIVWLYGHVGLVYDSERIISSHGSGGSGPGITFKSFKTGHLAQKSKECFENPWI